MLRAITDCRACGGELEDFLDLGKQYISDFRGDASKPPKYPLIATKCRECHLVQLRHSTPPQEMYHNRYGFKSGVQDKIIIDLDDIVTHAYQYVNDPRTWLDIGSNDGTLLSFVPHDVYRVGVDPVRFLCEEAQEHAEVIINDYFSDEIGGEFDVITTISCFYDMPNPSKFVMDVYDVLSEKGVWVIQQNYLLSTLQLRAVDNFCHEHLEYYTLLSLEHLLNKFGLEVNEVKLSTINGGSIRTVVSRKGTYPIDESVYRQRLIESEYGLTSMAPYKEFADHIADKLNELRDEVKFAVGGGGSVCVLGASTRGAVIWQAANIEEYLEYAVERNPAKCGKWFSAIGIPIISEEEFKEHPTDFAIVGPWFFADAFIDRYQNYLKNGGALILPLPEVEVIDASS